MRAESPHALAARPSLAVLVAVAAVVFLAAYNLTTYPVTWFDEGSHLHVPKTLVRFGVYADYSSEGFRPYGPTLGVGPTVMLPIAAALHFFGVGLLQARLVMLCYLLAAVWLFTRFARSLGGPQLAWCATALLISSRGVGLLEYGRQVLGEVPALCFLIAALWLWFASWEQPSWLRLVGVGLLFGAAVVTKPQFFLVIAPGLAVAWLANQLHYRLAAQRLFVVPALIAAVCLAGWLGSVIFLLAPGSAAENWATLRESAGGAALAFSPERMRRSAVELLSARGYLGALVPVLVYSALRALPRRREAQQWGVITIFVALNLAWYVFASVGWLRYAFPGLALASLLVARFFLSILRNLAAGLAADTTRALRWATAAWLAVMIALPLATTVADIVRPPPDHAAAMAAYLDAHVEPGALIESWETEMGFLTDHNYHFPPARLLNQIVRHVYLGGPPPWDYYRGLEEGNARYLLIGPFADGIDLYRSDTIARGFTPVVRIGRYELYAARGDA